MIDTNELVIVDKGGKGWTPEDFGLEDKVIIEVPCADRFNTLDGIKAFIAEQEDKGLDLSDIYIHEIYYDSLTPLNLLIIHKIIINSIDAEEVRDILRKFRQKDEYTRYINNSAIKEFSLSYAYSLYPEYKDVCLKIMQYLLNCGAERNCLIRRDEGEIPMLFLAIDLAVKRGDKSLWDLVKGYYKFKDSFYDTIKINGQDLDLLQYLAYQYRLLSPEYQLRIKENLNDIVGVLIDIIEPQAKAEYKIENTKKLGNFFEISGDNGWKPEDFGLESPPLSLRYPVTKKDSFGKEIDTNIIDRKTALIGQLVELENNLAVKDYISNKIPTAEVGNITLYLGYLNGGLDYSRIFGANDNFSEYANKVADIQRDFINNPGGYNDLDEFIDKIISLENEEVIAAVILNLEASPLILEGVKMLKYDPKGVCPHVRTINLLFEKQGDLEAIYNNENGLQDILVDLPAHVRNIVVFKLGLDYDRLNLEKKRIDNHNVDNIVHNVDNTAHSVNNKICQRTVAAALISGTGVLVLGAIMLTLANIEKEKIINFGVIDSLAKISPEMASVFKNIGVQIVMVVVLAGVVAGIAALITSAVLDYHERI